MIIILILNAFFGSLFEVEFRPFGRTNRTSNP